ncbi:MAG TPA: ATP-grasp domain-containing protein [Candidatus Saccharimonadales bacterium]
MHILIVGPYHSGYLYFPVAKELGMKLSVITTNRDDYAVPDEKRAQIDNFIIVDSFEPDTLVGAAVQLHQKDPVDGVLPGFEFLVEETAHVSHALGVRGLDPEKASLVRDKALMRQALHAADVRAPKFARATDALDLEHVIEQVGFPAVIKPVKMAVSIGVARVDNPVELLAAYEDIVNDDGVWSLKNGAAVVVEELLVGTEYVVDGCVTSNGEVDVFEFGEYALGPQPHFQILRFTAYHPEDLPQSDVMAAYIKEVVRAVGIVVGPFHAELIMTKDGPVLVEIANRLPGGSISELGESVTGKSMVKCALLAAVGQPIPEPAQPRARAASIEYILAPSELFGRAYKQIVGLDELVKSPSAGRLTIDIEPGTIIPPYFDDRSLVGELRYHGNSVEEVEAFHQRYINEVRIEG